MSKKVVINNVELQGEQIDARFGIINSHLTGEKFEVFTVSRDPKVCKDNTLRSLAQVDTAYTVQYYDENEQLFGTLINGRLEDYRITPKEERLRLSGTVQIL